MSRNLIVLTLLFFLMVPACLHLEKDTSLSQEPPEITEASETTEKGEEAVSTTNDPEVVRLLGSETVLKDKLENNLETSQKSLSLPVPKEEAKPKPKGPYRMNIGDVIEISVLDEPEMTRDITVIPDGTITYLLVGEMQAEGLTIAELRKSLTEALEEFYIAPYVSIITRKINLPPDDVKNISILGAVKNSGNFDWNKGDRVLDMIAQAGGLLYTQTEMGSRTTANLKASYISRNGKELDVDFYKLLRLGDMRYNILIEPDDFIYIADSEESTIVVMGEVQSPRIVPYTRNMTVVEALSICGGFTREAYQSRVVILRSREGETKYVEVDVNDLLHGRDVKNLMLEGGDIVYIPEQTLSEYARWAGFLVDIADLVLKGYEVRDAIRFPKLNRNSPSD